MTILVTGLFLAALLFWLGLVKSHWVAPAALFAESAPVVAALSWNQGFERIAAYLVVNIALFYAAFAVGRVVASRMDDRYWQARLSFFGFFASGDAAQSPDATA